MSLFSLYQFKTMPSKGARRRARLNGAPAAEKRAVCGVPYCETEPENGLNPLPCGHAFCVRCPLKTLRLDVDEGEEEAGFVSKCHLCREVSNVSYGGVIALVEAGCPDKCVIMDRCDTPLREVVIVCRDCNCGTCDGKELRILPRSRWCP